MPIDLEDALVQHRQGRLQPAARIYEAALAEDPDRSDALYLLGLIALQQGYPGRAVILISRAVAVRPETADYHAGLAEAFWALGQTDRALDGFRESLRLRPGHPEVLCNLGSTLVGVGELEAALASFRDALRLRPDFAPAHNNLGDALRIKGDTAAALNHFRAAVRLDPRGFEARNNLGSVLLQRGEPDEALIHCREAVRLGPNSLPALINLGNAALALGRLGEAAASFREAIRLRPEHAAGHACLGAVLEQLGESEAALGSFREALRHDPRHAGALARLATRLRDQLPETDRVAIERLLLEPGLADDQRSPLLFSLAHVYDARREFERASELTARANGLQLADFQTHGRSYEPAAFTAFVDQTIASFTSEFFTRVRGWGQESVRPVFVVGMPRSGTSLVEQILASHPRVFGAGELRSARQTFERLPAVTGRHQSLQDCLNHLGKEPLRELARQFLDTLDGLGRSADRVVDKMPENGLFFGLIAAMLPGATLIHCRRDARDTALSCWMTHFGQVRWACDLNHIATRFAEHRRLMTHWREVLPVPVLEVHYEAIVADPERVSRELVAWCGLDWDPACLEPHRSRRTVRTASLAQVRRPIYGSSVGRWKNYQRFLGAWFTELVSGEQR